MKADKLADARAKLYDVMHSASGMTADEIIESVTRQHPDVAKDASEKLIRMGWYRLINEATRRVNKTLRFASTQGELFGEFLPPDIITVPLLKKGKVVGRVRKDPLDATAGELRAWLSQQNPKRKPNARKRQMIERFAGALVKLGPHLKDRKTTLRQAMEMSAQAAAAAKA